jgi:membrane protein DedA with SNARE-associated domain
MRACVLTGALMRKLPPGASAGKEASGLVSHLLQSIPPEAVYLIVGLMIMVESLGIPVPGEIALVTAAVLATQHKMALSPAWIAASASAGAIAGDSMGYLIGHRAGSPLFDWLGRKFPRHFGPGHVALAERVFTRHGVWAVFFGRFIALLRIFAGPLAGSLRMPYGRFLLANATGGIVWATGITYLIWFLGVAAEKWMSRLSWLGLVAAVLVGLGITLLIRRKTRTLVSQAEAKAEAEAEARAEMQAGAEAAPTGTQPTPQAPSGAGAPAGAGAQAANGRWRAEQDRVAGLRESTERAD